MKYLSFPSQYDRFPKTVIPDTEGMAFLGFYSIIQELRKNRTGILAIEMYPGVDVDFFHERVIRPLNADHVFAFEKNKKNWVEYSQMLDDLLTEDRVFGVMTAFTPEDYFQTAQVASMKSQLLDASGFRIVYGFGASLLPHDHLVYVDITRWEIQLRFRKGMRNFSADNPQEDNLKKFKRGYFADWRVADQLKQSRYLQADYLISGDDRDEPVMIKGIAFQKGLDVIAHRPFRLIPYFDPGVWGGQWMKEVCNLPENNSNYAWSFDGVPEENALCFTIGGADFVFPAINLVFFRSKELLGHFVVNRFGKEFPIRFDFLDTMGGGNLSLQVHPLSEYIQKTFKMTYTQDESYYILDASEDSTVYLGVKKGIRPEELIRDLEKANSGKGPFPEEKYINKFPVKKHDHLLIPAGTIHCSGKNTMVLEISATPYIFTFKLWDWGRLGLDGLPRPVHINHGKNVIQYSRDTDWVKQNLINRFERINDHEIRTGLHELEFIETRRLSFGEAAIETDTEGSVNVLNLVEGQSAIVESIDGSFPAFTVHYAETFVLPASVGVYRLRSLFSASPCMVIKAFIRS
jgi:mannose-6-phosphate isomerase class I